jgi:hypothetical protein
MTPEHGITAKTATLMMGEKRPPLTGNWPHHRKKEAARGCANTSLKHEI